MRVISAVLAAALGLAANVAQAVVLYEQPLVSWDSGNCSPCSIFEGNIDAQTFGSFSLASDSVLESGSFALTDFSPNTFDLNISIWDVPNGTELFSLNAPGGSYGVVPNPDDEYFYAVVDLPNWPLAAGSYWVSLFGTNGNTIGWGTDFAIGDDAQYDGSGSLNSDELYVGFSLSGIVVPEPGSLTLIVLGPAGLGFLRRRGS